jgi:hypothetical protein
MGFLRVTVHRGGMPPTRPSKPARTAACAAALLVATTVLAGCTSSSSPSSGNPTPTSTALPGGPAATGTGSATGITWVIERNALDELHSSGMSTSQLSALFDNSDTYLVGGFGSSAQPDISGWTSHRTLTSTNLSSSKVPSGVTALLYDNESWSLTPRIQQENPSEYEAKALGIAQQKGLVLISTPATDLANVLDPGPSNTMDQRYLQLGIIGQAARNSNIVDIQSQGLEGSSQFTEFVTEAAQQAKQANPNVVVLAGISTNPSGHQISAQTFEQDANSVRSVVNGYWLNIPAAGTACPRCGTPQPQVAIPWLDQLLGQ